MLHDRSAKTGTFFSFIVHDPTNTPPGSAPIFLMPTNGTIPTHVPISPAKSALPSATAPRFSRKLGANVEDLSPMPKTVLSKQDTRNTSLPNRTDVPPICATGSEMRFLMYTRLLGINRVRRPRKNWYWRAELRMISWACEESESGKDQSGLVEGWNEEYAAEYGVFRG
jgi:hypothetical protein